jgi:hypothetical protein
MWQRHLKKGFMGLLIVLAARRVVVDEDDDIKNVDVPVEVINVLEISIGFTDMGNRNNFSNKTDTLLLITRLNSG